VRPCACAPVESSSPASDRAARLSKPFRRDFIVFRSPFQFPAASPRRGQGVVLGDDINYHTIYPMRAENSRVPGFFRVLRVLVPPARGGIGSRTGQGEPGIASSPRAWG